MHWYPPCWIGEPYRKSREGRRIMAVRRFSRLPRQPTNKKATMNLFFLLPLTWVQTGVVGGGGHYALWAETYLLYIITDFPSEVTSTMQADAAAVMTETVGLVLSYHRDIPSLFR